MSELNELFRSPGLNGYSSIFRQLYVPTALYSENEVYFMCSMFRQLYVPTVGTQNLFIFQKGSMFRQLYIPTALYSDCRNIEPFSFSKGFYVPTALYSDSSIFRQFCIPTLFGIQNCRNIELSEHRTLLKNKKGSMFRQSEFRAVGT